MKKLISLILVMVLLFGCVISASAYSPLPEDSEAYKQLRKIEAEHLPLLAEYVAENADGANVKSIRILYQGKINGEQYYVFSFDSDDKVEKEFFYRMGMYAVEAQYEFPVFAEGYTVYTASDNQWHSLKYLYENDPNGMHEVAYLYIHNDSGINDVSFITAFSLYTHPIISNATDIQKYLAGIKNINEERVRYLDIDNDGDITIKDATAIQKYIAGLEVEIYDSVV